VSEDMKGQDLPNFKTKWSTFITLVQERKKARPAAKHRERNDAIIAACASGCYSYREIAEFFGIHLATVGRLIRQAMPQCET